MNRRRALLAASQTGGGNEEVTFTVQAGDGRVETYTIPQMSWAEFIESEYNPMSPLGDKYFVIATAAYGSWVASILTYGGFDDFDYIQLYVLNTLEIVYPDDIIISTTYGHL